MFKWIKNLFTTITEPYKGSNNTFTTEYTHIAKLLEIPDMSLDMIQEANLHMGLLITYATTQGDLKLMDTLNAKIAIALHKAKIRKRGA